MTTDLAIQGFALLCILIGLYAMTAITHMAIPEGPTPPYWTGPPKKPRVYRRGLVFGCRVRA